MCFHNKSYLDYCKLKIDESRSRVRVTKFLRVLVDENCHGLYYHINAVCKNVSKNIYVTGYL